MSASVEEGNNREIGSLLKHNSSAVFVRVFQALGCCERNDWLKLKFFGRGCGFGGGFSVLWILVWFGGFLTQRFGYFRGCEGGNLLEQSHAVSRRNVVLQAFDRRIKHLDFLSILSYMAWD